METTKSKITLNLYGNKHKAEICSSDPELSEIVHAFVVLLESHDFELEDIMNSFAGHIVKTLNTEDGFDLEDVFEFQISKPNYDPASTNATSEPFFDAVTRKKSKK